MQADNEGSYPVSLMGELDPNLSRGLWLVKWLLAIPHFVILFFPWIAFLFSTIFAFFSILFTGKYPQGLFNFNVGVLRWHWRVAFYCLSVLGTDRYPPFSLNPADYPATLEIEYPERLSRGLVLVKWWLLAIPHYLILGLLQGGSGPRFGGLNAVLVVIAVIVLLFTGRYHQDIYRLVLGINQWSMRVVAYASLMTDRYPPFRIGE